MGFDQVGLPEIILDADTAAIITRASFFSDKVQTFFRRTVDYFWSPQLEKPHYSASCSSLMPTRARQIPHCVSSRFVLSHYHRCKDLKCAVCAPVREVIAKSHQRQMSVQVSWRLYEYVGGLMPVEGVAAALDCYFHDDVVYE